MDNIIRNVKELKEYLNNFPDEMLLFRYNEDDSAIELFEPLEININSFDKKDRLYTYSVDNINKNFDISAKIGDHILVF